MPEDDTEITPEMIEAGTAIFYGKNLHFYSAEEIVASIFTAMLNAAICFRAHAD